MTCVSEKYIEIVYLCKSLFIFFFIQSANEKIAVEIGVAAAVVTLVYKCYQRPANFPPGSLNFNFEFTCASIRYIHFLTILCTNFWKLGPRGLPIVGYIPFIGNHDPKYPYKAMMKLSSIYDSSVVGFYLGPSQPFISVCGYEAVKEALHHDDFNGRPALKIRMITDGKIHTGLGNFLFHWWTNR